MSSTTFNAFLARGIDNQLASELVAKGKTLKLLKQHSKAELIALGLDTKTADSILKEPRPPIPEGTVIKMLYESKRTCCICRDSGRSIIIHHIDEWSTYKSHAEENLIVLCLEHHDEVHTKKNLVLI